MLIKNLYFLPFILFSYLSFSKTSFYDTCPAIEKNCPSPTEIMKDPKLATSTSFEEGFECHMNRFVAEHVLEPEPPELKIYGTQVDDEFVGPPAPELCGPSSWQDHNSTATATNDLMKDLSSATGQAKKSSTTGKIRRLALPNLKRLKESTPAIDPICFYGGSIRHKKTFNSQKSFYSCPDYNSASPQGGHSKEGACLSESYSEKLAAIFDHITSCLNFCTQDKREFFKIINHESAFAPNAKSPSNARCMGQLTQSTVSELQQNIVLKKRAPNTSFVANYEHFDFKNSSCAHLDQYTIPPNFEENLFPLMDKVRGRDLRRKSARTYSRYAQSGDESFYYECKVLSNPVQCLLYSALNHRKNMNTYMNSFQPEEVDFKRHLMDATDEDIKKFSQFVDDSEIGLSPTELYISESEGSKEKLFRTSGGAYREFLKTKGSDSTKMKKINIFSKGDMENLKTLILRISYNGGNAISRTMAKNVISDIRDYIANPNLVNEKSRDKYISYREKIIKGTTIPLKSIQEDLIRVLSSKISTRRSRREEFRNYHTNVVKHMDYLLNKGNILKGQFSKHKGTSNKRFTRQFAKEIQSKCASINQTADSCR